MRLRINMGPMRVAFVCLATLAVTSSTARANINLEWRPESQAVRVDDTVSMGLYAVSDTSEDQLLMAADVFFTWAPSHLHLIGVDNTGAVPLLFSGFPATDPCNVNEVVPPQDGTGYYLAWANLGSPVAATPSGTLLTTFVFQAVSDTTLTEVAILENAGSGCDTTVWHGTIPNTDITGTLGSGFVQIVLPCSPTVGDVNRNDVIDLADIGAAVQVLLQIDTQPEHIAATDANCDGAADGLDLQPLVDFWLLLL